MVFEEYQLHISQEEVLDVYKEKGWGTGTVDELKAWAYFGFTIKRHDDFIHDCIFVGTVPSLNNCGGNHRVVFDMRSHRIYDPNEGKGGELYYDHFQPSKASNHLWGWGELFEPHYVGSYWKRK